MQDTGLDGESLCAVAQPETTKLLLQREPSLFGPLDLTELLPGVTHILLGIGDIA